METLKEERDKVLSELSLAEKKTKMQTEIESMEKALPEKIEKPKVEELKDEEKQRKTFLSNVLKNNELKVQQMQIVKKIKERKKLFYLADFIAKQFSQKGIVSQNLLGKYIKTLTDAASKAEAETGIRVIFKMITEFPFHIVLMEMLIQKMAVIMKHFPKVKRCLPF